MPFHFTCGSFEFQVCKAFGVDVGVMCKVDKIMVSIVVRLTGVDCLEIGKVRAMSWWRLSRA